MQNKYEKYLGFVFLVAAFIVLLMQCSAVAGILEDSVNGYSFEYPFGWKAQVFPDSKDLVKAEINKEANTGVQIRIYKTKRDLRNFLEWYVEDFMRQMQKHWGGDMVVYDQKFANVAGQECFVVMFDFIRRDNKRWFLKQYLWPVDNGVLVLQSGTLFELRLLNEPEIDSIARSLKFVR